jgi:guanosine-3',5'-bis(diphosphate) 3'-pyrophosphohydrolase
VLRAKVKNTVNSNTFDPSRPVVKLPFYWYININMSENFTQKQLYLSDKLLEALEFASLAHHGQRRRGGEKVPYISHPAAVGMILLRGGFSEDVIIAGILHDVVEDTRFTAGDIEKKFGSRVRKLVEDVSEDKSLPWRQRKQAYLDHLHVASPDALAISAADFLANTLSLKQNLEHHGVELLKEWYSYSDSIIFNTQRLEILKQRLSHPIVQELELVFAEADRIYKEKNG